MSLLECSHGRLPPQRYVHAGGANTNQPPSSSFKGRPVPFLNVNGRPDSGPIRNRRFQNQFYTELKNRPYNNHLKNPSKYKPNMNNRNQRDRWNASNDFYRNQGLPNGCEGDHIWFNRRLADQRNKSLSASNLRDIGNAWFDNEPRGNMGGGFYPSRRSGFNSRNHFRAANYQRFRGKNFYSQPLPAHQQIPDSRPRHSRSKSPGPSWAPNNSKSFFWEDDIRCSERAMRSSSLPREMLREARPYQIKQELPDAYDDRPPVVWSSDERIQPPTKRVKVEWGDHRRRSQSVPRDVYASPPQDETIRLQMPDWSPENRKHKPNIRPSSSSSVKEAPLRSDHSEVKPKSTRPIKLETSSHANSEKVANTHTVPSSSRSTKEKNSDGPADCWSQVDSFMKTLDPVGKRMFMKIWSITPQEDDNEDELCLPPKEKEPEKAEGEMRVFRSLLPSYSEEKPVGIEGLKTVDLWVCSYCSVYLLSPEKCDAHMRTKEHYIKYQAHLKAFRQWKNSQLFSTRLKAASEPETDPAEKDTEGQSKPDNTNKQSDEPLGFSVRKLDDEEWDPAFEEDDLDYT